MGKAGYGRVSGGAMPRREDRSLPATPIASAVASVIGYTRLHRAVPWHIVYRAWGWRGPRLLSFQRLLNSLWDA